MSRESTTFPSPHMGIQISGVEDDKEEQLYKGFDDPHPKSQPSPSSSPSSQTSDPNFYPSPHSVIQMEF